MVIRGHTENLGTERHYMSMVNIIGRNVEDKFAVWNRCLPRQAEQHFFEWSYLKLEE